MREKNVNFSIDGGDLVLIALICTMPWWNWGTIVSADRTWAQIGIDAAYLFAMIFAAIAAPVLAILMLVGIVVLIMNRL